MGNQYAQFASVNAAEKPADSKGYFATLKSTFMGSSEPEVKPHEDPVVSSPIQASSSKGAGGDAPPAIILNDTPVITKSDVEEVNPRTISSSLPEFPGTWNELHKAKGKAIMILNVKILT